MSPEKETKIDETVEELQKRILQGFYAAGQRIPSEREIAEELGVSRVTVRAALLRLQAENILDIVPRGGVFVRSTGAKATITSGSELKQAGSFMRAMEQQGRQTLVRFLEPPSIIPTGHEIGAKMKIDPGASVLRRYCVHLVDRVPYRILDSYYPASLFGDLLRKNEGDTSLFQWLRERTGVRAAHARECLNCRMPTAEEASLLHISRGQPVIDMDHWLWGDDGTLLEYTHVIANGAFHEFAYTYDIDEEISR